MKYLDKLDSEFLLEQGLKLAGNKITAEQYLNVIDNLIAKFSWKQANGVSTGERQSNIPDVINSVCVICGKHSLENNLCYEHLVCNVPKPPSKTDL